MLRIILDFSSEAIQVRRVEDNIFSVKKNQGRKEQRKEGEEDG